MEYDYMEQLGLLEDCYWLFHNCGYARSRAAFCRKYLKRSGSYMAKLNPERLPSVAVWGKIYVALMEIRKNLIPLPQKHNAQILLSRLKDIIDSL